MNLPTKNEVKKVQKKVLENRKKQKQDWYDGLSFEEVSILFHHAKNGYFTKSMGHFTYPDAQSNLFYVRVELLVKYLRFIEANEGIERARWIYANMQCCGWNTFLEINGVNIFCRGECTPHIKKFLEDGILPENGKWLN